MKTYLIIVNSMDSSRKYDLGKNLPSDIEAKDRPCHVLENLWCIRSDQSIKDIYGALGDKVIDPSDSFVIVPVAGPWLVQNAKSQGDCFDLNE
jgi:hypothetical protein